MPHREIMAELETRRKELEAENGTLEAQIDGMKVNPEASGVVDDMPILAKREPPDGAITSN